MEWLKGWSSWDSQVWSEAECCWSLSLPLSAPTISSSWDKESTRGVDSEVPPLQRDSLVKWLKHRNIAPHLLCLEEETNLFRLKLIRDLGARTLELIEKEHVTCVSVAREEIWAYWNYRETSPGSRISCPNDLPQLLSLGPSLKGKTIQHLNRRKHLTTAEASPNLYSEDPTTEKSGDQKAKR